jgi:DNA polymerase V
MIDESKLKTYSVSTDDQIPIPLIGSSVNAGFPSPVDDFIEMNISLDSELVCNKEVTF